MKMNVTDAAKAVGKSRKTLYRHMDKGQLSYDEDATGNRVIDVSELQRVYNKVDTGVTGGDAGQSESVSQPDTPKKATDDTELQLLKMQLEHVERERETEKERRREAERREEEARDEVRRLLGIVESHTRQLPAPESEAETKEEESQKRRKWFGLF